MKLLLTVMILVGMAWADVDPKLQSDGVYVEDTDGEAHIVKRIIPSGCRVPVTVNAVWKAENVAEVCKNTLVKTAGFISPISIAPGVETYGEVEVLAFLEAMHDKKNNFLLVDSRGNDWYEYETIPGAVNLWFRPMKEPKIYPQEFTEILKKMGGKVRKDGTYDFSQAATMVLFCNGPWCSQSPLAAKGLLAIGYPPEKIKWYRGGMHVWKSLSMATTRDVVE